MTKKKDDGIERASIGDEACRFTLTRRWGYGPPMAVLMLNPSMADAERDDLTVKRLIHFARSWGKEALTIVNVVPFRTPHPGVLWGILKNERENAILANLGFIAEEAAPASVRIVAFGNEIGKRHPELLDRAITAFTHPSATLHCLGLTKSGAPKHPMARGKHRVPDDALPVPFIYQLSLPF